MNIKTAILSVIFSGVLLYAQTKDLRQYVVDWPAGYDTTGTHWVVYNLYSAQIDWLTESSVGSYTGYSPSADMVVWLAQLANFQGSSPPWDIGDTIVVLGSMDTAYVSNPAGYGDNLNHTGFYWVYSDTIIMETPELWQPDDTLRPMAKPIVYKTGPGGGANDTIWVKIPNPRETRRVDQTEYDVLGFWLWADSTGTGTPNAFNAASAMEIAFVPATGVYEDTTVFWMLESDSFLAWNHWTTYFVYKLVARPDMTLIESPDSPGYATDYFSRNSDPIDVYQNVIGIEENLDLECGHLKLNICPNPFTERTEIKLNTGHSASEGLAAGGIGLKIYDASGQLVKDFSCSTPNVLRPTFVVWDGTSDRGKRLPAGVYIVRLEAGEFRQVQKLVLLH
jgi:hypothetical protein